MKKIFASPRTIDEKNRTIEFVASTEAVDRYGDVIRVSGWKYANYLKNPVFLWAHRSGDPPIGKTIDLRIESKPPALVQTVQFADAATYPFADTIFNLYKEGFLNAVSVGFRPTENPTFLKDEEGRVTGYEFIGQELLELSAVPIPANQEALARAVTKGILSEEQRAEFEKDVEPDESGEQPEDESAGSLDDLAEEVEESLAEIQTALTDAVANLAVLHAAIQSGQKSVKRQQKARQVRHAESDGEIKSVAELLDYFVEQ